MNVNISNFIESVANPKGRFRSLKDVYAVNDRDGSPVINICSQWVDFEVISGGHNYVMKCARKADDDTKRHLKEASVFVHLSDSPYMSEYLYLENEMLVFDNFDQPYYVDIVINKIPDGKRLDILLGDKSAVNSDSVSYILKGIADMGRWMADNDVTHGRITSSAIWIGPSFNPVLMDYSAMRRGVPFDDVKSLALISAVIYLSACEPGFYDYIGRNIISGKESTPGTLPALSELISGGAPECLKKLGGIVTSVAPEEDSKAAVHNICSDIEALSECKPQPVKYIRDMLDKLNIRDQPAACPLTMQERISKYRFVGELRDMLIRVWDGEYWYFLNKNGETAIDAKFISTTDFWEGRAVVEVDTGYGMIDRDGGYIIEPEFDDIEWDASGNLAIVTREGLSGLYTREGESVTGLIYDQLLNISDELIAAKKNKKYGYISRDGRVVIDFIYEDAFGFRDGMARVKFKGREYLIDKKGKEIGEIATPKPVPII